METTKNFETKVSLQFTLTYTKNRNGEASCSEKQELNPSHVQSLAVFSKVGFCQLLGFARTLQS